MDFIVSNHGSVIMVTPVTQDAKDWTTENVQLESWQWMGAAFAVDQHCIDNLIDGIRADGLNVQ